MSAHQQQYQPYTNNMNTPTQPVQQQQPRSNSASASSTSTPATRLTLLQAFQQIQQTHFPSPAPALAPRSNNYNNAHPSQQRRNSSRNSSPSRYHQNGHPPPHPSSLTTFHMTNTPTSNNNNNIMKPTSHLVQYKTKSEHEMARKKALEEASLVSNSIVTFGGETMEQQNQQQQYHHQHQQKNASNSTTANALEHFNLLSVVTTPASMMMDVHNSHHRRNSLSSTDGNGIDNNSNNNHNRISSQQQNNHTNETSQQQHQQHQRQQPPDIDTIPSADGTINSLGEFSLSSVTETLTKEIDSLNSTLYTYSRTYLGDLGTAESMVGSVMGGTMVGNMIGATSTSGTSGGISDASSLLDFRTELGYEDIPTHQLEELPDEIVNLDLLSVETYLRTTGALTNRFGMRDGESERVLVGEECDVVPPVAATTGGGGGGGDGGDGTTTSPMKEGEDGETIVTEGSVVTTTANEKEEGKTEGDNDNNKNPVVAVDDPTSSVPEIFFSPYFDLTDPKTFESLLVMDDDDDDDDDIDNEDEDENIMGRLGGAEKLKPLVQIQKPERLTQHLDNIELALLKQVRSKSDSFFRETNRFSYLKSLVAESVDEVKELRSHLQTIRERSINNVGLVPLMDKNRNDMRTLGEITNEIMDVMEVKGSVAGLIAAGDYLGAIEAIQMARRLLKGEDNNGKKCVLGKLHALKKVNDQLEQYENLVVMDLSNELIEIFLNWDASTSLPTSTFLAPDKSSSIDTAGRRLKVINTVKALKKCQKLSSIADTYRDKLCDTIRVTVRTTVSECAVDATKSTEFLSPSTTGMPSKPDGLKGRSASLSSALVNAPPNTDTKTRSKSTSQKSSITEGVIGMTFEQFLDCLQMIFDQTLALLQSAASLNTFFREEGIVLKDDNEEQSSNNAEDGTKGDGVTQSISSFNAVSSGSDLAHKSVSELLRLRKEAHSLVSLEEMKRLWDACLTFTLQVEKFSGQKAYGLRSTLVAQAKAFVERKHEGNMASLVAALDGERWNQCDISGERQAAVNRLCSGHAALSSSSSRSKYNAPEMTETTPDVQVEGRSFRVVWSCLLLVEMIMGNVACAAHFQTLTTNTVGKVKELLRLFNSRATQLVLGAGAIHSAARLKSINAKHLALVTQCVGMVLAILPHVREALMAQMPSKQHTLLAELDVIKKEYLDHSEKVLSKFVSIIGGIVEHGLAPRLGKTNFDQRSSIPPKEANSNNASDRARVDCCPFIDGMITNTKKMHQVLLTHLPADDLKDVFSRIFSYLDSKVPTIFINADNDGKHPFSFPSSIEGKRRLLMEIEELTITLNGLSGVRPWEFAAIKFLERRLEITYYEDDEVVDDSKSASENDDETEISNEGESGVMANHEDKTVNEKAAETENVEIDPGQDSEPIDADVKDDVKDDNTTESIDQSTSSDAVQTPLNDATIEVSSKDEANLTESKTDNESKSNGQSSNNHSNGNLQNHNDTTSGPPL